MSDRVHVPDLISKVFNMDHQQARSALLHGRVGLGDLTLGLPQMDMDRQDLGGLTIRVGNQEAEIAPNARSARRVKSARRGQGRLV